MYKKWRKRRREWSNLKQCHQRANLVLYPEVSMLDFYLNDPSLNHSKVDKLIYEIFLGKKESTL